MDALSALIADAQLLGGPGGDGASPAFKHEDVDTPDSDCIRAKHLAMRRSGGSTRSIELAALSDALADWTARAGPTYLRLAGAIGDAIAQGQVDLNARLPAERALASHLSVSRGTVVAAYDALRARGVVHTRRGSGTVVHGRATMARAHRAPQLSRLVAPRGAAIDLALAALQLGAADLPDLTVSLRRAAGLLRGHGYAPLGAPALREILAARFCARAVPTEPEQILITSGGQSALSLIAATLLNASDHVVTESPTYPAALEVFVRTGARVDGLRRDHAGPIIQELEQALAGQAPQILYLIPTCHNPTGGVMSEARRRAVIRRIQATRRTLVIEDAALEDLLLDGTPPPLLAALAPDRVITVGSLSKTIWGGLRVGWIRASPELILRIGRLKASLELGSSGLEQLAAIAALERYDELAAQRRELLRERLGTLCEELSTQLPDWEFAEPRGGLSVWARLPEGSADRLAQHALHRGVAISSGRSASPSEEFANHVRICAGAPAAQIRVGVARVAEAWQELLLDFPPGLARVSR